MQQGDGIEKYKFVPVPCNQTKDAAHIDLENWPELGPDSGPDGGVNRSLPGS
jgi:hypothetical protein